MQCQRDAERERESNLFRFGSRNSTLDCKVVFALPLPRSQSPVTLPFYPIFCLFRFWGFRPYSVIASCVSQVGQGRQSADKQSVSEMWNEEQPTRRAAATAKQWIRSRIESPSSQIRWGSSSFSYCRGNTQPHTQKEGGKGKEKRAPLACPLLPDIANKARRIRYHFFRSG